MDYQKLEEILNDLNSTISDKVECTKSKSVGYHGDAAILSACIVNAPSCPDHGCLCDCDVGYDECWCDEYVDNCPCEDHQRINVLPKCDCFSVCDVY